MTGGTASAGARRVFGLSSNRQGSGGPCRPRGGVMHGAARRGLVLLPILGDRPAKRCAGRLTASPLPFPHLQEESQVQRGGVTAQVGLCTLDPFSTHQYRSAGAAALLTPD